MRFLLFLLLPVFCLSCAKDERVEKKPQVLVSVPPYLYFVSRIAGDTVEVATLVPPGSNAHTYEPTPKEVEKAFRVSLWIRLGEAYDKKILHVLKEHNPHLEVAEVTEGIDLLDGCKEAHHTHCHGEGKDLHIWLSPRLAKVQAETIARALIALQPEHKTLYLNNLQEFSEDLSKLDTRIATLLKPLEGSAILVTHPAFAYFCRDYSLTQLSLEVEGKEPLPQDIAHIIARARQLHVRSVFAEPQYTVKGAELVAEKLQIPVYMVDPYSSEYLKNLEDFAKLIAGK